MSEKLIVMDSIIPLVNGASIETGPFECSDFSKMKYYVKASHSGKLRIKYSNNIAFTSETVTQINIGANIAAWENFFVDGIRISKYMKFEFLNDSGADQTYLELFVWLIADGKVL